ncbi:MAG: hypothetical protein ACPL3E_01630 [Minisyncoccia bacterium]
MTFEKLLIILYTFIVIIQVENKILICNFLESIFSSSYLDKRLFLKKNCQARQELFEKINLN